MIPPPVIQDKRHDNLVSVISHFLTDEISHAHGSCGCTFLPSSRIFKLSISYLFFKASMAMIILLTLRSHVDCIYNRKDL